MRSRIAFVMTLLAIVGCDSAKPSVAPPVDGRSDLDRVRAADDSVLFVGNSHTTHHDLPNLVAELIRHARPGRTVYTWVESVAFLEDVETNPHCRAEIDKRPWKHVVLQGQKISVSGRFEYSSAAGIEFARRAIDGGAGADVIFYPEWGRAGVAGDGANQERVYREMAREAGAGVVPVARAWDAALAGRPELPLHAADGNHQSRVGAFLTACVLAARIADVDPAAFASYPDPAVGLEDRKYLTGVAARTLAMETK
jgi:hypothetical protein